ncbi:MAG TPA: hypothetical protein VJ804_08015, partial [Acidimicrobiales bacterium]|nr:hypothetical protein [Acidimicrobiales bacterium]
PRAYLDDGPPATTRRAGRDGVTTTSTLPEVLTGLATGGDGSGSAVEADDEPTTTTTAPPLLEVTVGAGSTLGLGVGDRCTGLELFGATLGCPPDTADEGLTLDVDSALLPGS